MKGLSISKRILLVILLVAAGICLLLGIKVQQAICNNVYILSFLKEGKCFLNSDISIVENGGIRLAYVKYLYPEISNGFRAETATVIATNDNYSYFTGLEIEEGTFFNQIQADRKLSVAVLNEEAAYQFFGNYDCIGESLYLDQNVFEVIGIVREQGDEGEAKVYIPDTTADTLGISCSEVNQLWCRFTNMAEASLMISNIGYSMSEMNILRVDLYKSVFMLRFFTVLIFIGIILFIRTFKAAFSVAKNLGKVGAMNGKWLIKWILQILICTGSLLFAVKITQLSWCVPPNYELLGKSWKDVLYRTLEFYTLSGIEMDNMQFVNRWNLLAMSSQIVCIWAVVLFFIEMSTKRCDNSFDVSRRNTFFVLF